MLFAPSAMKTQAGQIVLWYNTLLFACFLFLKGKTHEAKAPSRWALPALDRRCWCTAYLFLLAACKQVCKQGNALPHQNKGRSNKLKHFSFIWWLPRPIRQPPSSSRFWSPEQWVWGPREFPCNSHISTQPLLSAGEPGFLAASTPPEPVPTLICSATALPRLQAFWGA